MTVPVIHVSGEGIFPYPHSRPHIGMSIERAADFIRQEWQDYMETGGKKDQEEEERIGHRQCSEIQLTGDTTLDMLYERIRDCGWCIGHQGGRKALLQLLELATKELDPDGEGYKLSRHIDHAFHGIAGWMA